MNAQQVATEICRYLGSGDKLITQDLMQSRDAIAEIIERNTRRDTKALERAKSLIDHAITDTDNTYFKGKLIEWIEEYT